MEDANVQMHSRMDQLTVIMDRHARSAPHEQPASIVMHFDHVIPPSLTF